MDVEKKGILRLLVESWGYLMRDKKYTLKVVLLVTMVNIVFILLIACYSIGVDYIIGYPSRLSDIEILPPFVFWASGFFSFRAMVALLINSIMIRVSNVALTIGISFQALYVFIYTFVLLMPIVSIAKRTKLNDGRWIGKSILYTFMSILMPSLNFAILILLVWIVGFFIHLPVPDMIVSISLIVLAVSYIFPLIALKLFKYVYIVDGYPIGRAVSRFMRIIWRKEIFKYIVYSCIFYMVFIAYDVLIGVMVIAFKSQSNPLYYIGLLMFTLGFSAFEVFNGSVSYVFYRYLSDRAGVDNALTDG